MNAKDAAELCRLTAAEAVDRLARREVTPIEMVEASAARIEAVEPHLNALPTRCFDRARDHAERIMRGAAPAGRLRGLPVAIKDMNPVAGVRTTYGSTIYAEHVPERSDVLVEMAEDDGAIVMAKSNTPEFAAGASTFNEVFGKTRNPWDVSRSVAGSSGGSAAALASGEVWLAHGSDLGGSLRIPGSFNGVVGFRPSPGRVPRGARHPFETPVFDTLFVDGPMARTVEDVALFLDTLSGIHPDEPLSYARPEKPYLEAARTRRAPSRIGYSPNLGIVRVDSRVAAVCDAAVGRFAQAGTRVEADCADFSEAIDSFRVLRGALYAAEHEVHLREHRDRLKPEVVWNIEKGLEITAAEIGRAELARSRLVASLGAFFERHDLLVCPTVIVAPFDVDVRYVEEVEGERFDNYFHWLALTFVLSITGCPSLSLPAGYTEEGLPVGLQLVAPPRAEGELLAAAGAFEAVLGLAADTPIDPRGPQGARLLHGPIALGR